MTRDFVPVVRRALGLPPQERDRFLVTECGDDAALLAKLRRILGTGAFAGGRAPSDPDPGEVPGARIGRYELLHGIGEGGMGTVWLAVQREPVQRPVALKLVKLGMDTRQVIARFQAEQQALALMSHPGIARVFDAGETPSGRPYFVMEYIDGVPIVQYCDDHALGTRARLRLFVGLCRAIEHAHQKGVIHRDIKPSNVLVSEEGGSPQVKVIDFGISKATRGFPAVQTLATEHRQFVGTPAYMSPEQADSVGADIDTRSDVYSLGVLLYELLTGSTPFDVEAVAAQGLGELLRVIRSETPLKPSTRVATAGGAAERVATARSTGVKGLGLALRGDLDWIVMKCLEKDRARRYGTVEALLADVERHLCDEPVSAGPPSVTRRLLKFARRNRVAVVAGAAVVLALMLGGVGLAIGLARALDERREAIAARAVASERADDLEHVTEFQARQFGRLDARRIGEAIRASLVTAIDGGGSEDLAAAFDGLDFTGLTLRILEGHLFGDMLAAIDTTFVDRPAVHGRLLQSMATILREVGSLEMALDPQRRALEVRRRHLGPDDRETLRSMHHLGYLHSVRNEFQQAEPLLREALEAGARLFGEEDVDTLDLLTSLALLLDTTRQRPEAEGLYRRALDGHRRVHGDEHPGTVRALGNMGGVLRLQGRFAEAEPYYAEALATLERLAVDEDDEGRLSLIAGYGSLLWRLDRHREAEPHLRRVLDADRRLLGELHPYTASSMSNLGSLLQAMGRLEEAEPHLRRALTVRRELLGEDSQEALASANNLALLLQRRGALAEAEGLYRLTLAAQRRTLRADHPDTLTTAENLGSLHQAQQDFEQAEALLREVLDRRRASLGEDDARTLRSHRSLAALLAAAGRTAEAEAQYRDCLARQERVLGPDHRDTERTRDELRTLRPPD